MIFGVWTQQNFTRRHISEFALFWMMSEYFVQLQKIGIVP